MWVKIILNKVFHAYGILIKYTMVNSSENYCRAFVVQYSQSVYTYFNNFSTILTSEFGSVLFGIY